MSTQAKREARVQKYLDNIMAIDGGWEVLLDVVHRRGIQRTMREARIVKGMTQAEVAKRMDVSQPTLSEMETERYPDYRLSTLRRWAMALELRTHWELTEIPQEQEEE